MNKNNLLENNNKLFENNLPISFFDVVNDTLNKIHKELFNDALNNYEKYKKETDSNYSIKNLKIIELKNSQNYLKPSKIMIFNHNDDGTLTREIIDLTDYWNTNYVNNEYITHFNDLLIDNDNKKQIELEDIDYINGIIKFKNKYNNKTFSVNTNKIDFNLTYKNKLENTFGDLLKNVRK